MRRARRSEGLNLALLDVMACGLGAAVLVFMLVKFEQDVSIPEQDLLQAELEQLQAAAAELAREKAQLEDDTQSNASRVENAKAQAEALADALDALEAEKDARAATVADLKSRIASMPPRETADTVTLDAAGEENYLIGLRVEGERIAILVDASASMTDYALLDILRVKGSSDADRRSAQKWRRTIRTVEWLLARAPQSAQVSVIAYNESAFIVGSQDWTSARNQSGLQNIIRALNDMAPAGGTNLESALTTARRIDPTDLYIITDGLPTKGDTNFRSISPFADCSALWGGSATISGECRRKLFAQTVNATPAKAKVNVIMMPLEGDPGAAELYWRWANLTGGVLLSPAAGWP